MPLNYGEAVDLDAHAKILVFGPSGSGKSYLASRAGSLVKGDAHGRVAVLLLEPNGLPSIRYANPNALVVLAYEPKRYGKAETWDVVEQFLRDALDGSLAAAGVTTLVVDSLIELQRVWRDKVLVEDGVERKRLALHKMTQQQWGSWTERFRRLIRAFRDLPYNLVCVNLPQNETDEEGNVTAVVPSFDGKKLPGEIAQYFSAVGYTFKRAKKRQEGEKLVDDGVEYRVMFQTGTKIVVKPLPGLDAIEVPEPLVWFAKIAEANRIGASAPSIPALGTAEGDAAKAAEAQALAAASPKPDAKPDAAPKVVSTSETTAAVVTTSETAPKAAPRSRRALAVSATPASDPSPSSTESGASPEAGA